MEQRETTLMERLDRSFVEHLRAGLVHRESLMAVYYCLKERELRSREVSALLHFADPLAAALLCWKRIRQRTGNCYVLRVIFRLGWSGTAGGTDARFVFFARMCLFCWQGSSRKRHALIMSNHQIIYGGGSRSARRGRLETEAWYGFP